VPPRRIEVDVWPCSTVEWRVSSPQVIRWKRGGVSYQVYPYCRRINIDVRFCDVVGGGWYLGAYSDVYLLPERDNSLSCCWNLAEKTSFDDIYVNWQRTFDTWCPVFHTLCDVPCTWTVYACLAYSGRFNLAWWFNQIYAICNLFCLVKYVYELTIRTCWFFWSLLSASTYISTTRNRIPVYNSNRNCNRLPYGSPMSLTLVHAGTHACTHTYVRAYTCTHKCTQTHTEAHTHTHTHVRTYTWLHTQAHEHQARRHKHTHKHAYIHARIKTYIHKNVQCLYSIPKGEKAIQNFLLLDWLYTFDTERQHLKIYRYITWYMLNVFLNNVYDNWIKIIYMLIN